MKKVELESFIKSFLLFFLSQSLLVGALFYINYKTEVQTLDESIFSKMRVCNFNLQCDEFEIDFVPKDTYELYKLYKNENSLSAYFAIPNSEKNILKIYLSKDEYQKRVLELQIEVLIVFFIVLSIVAVLSFFFSIYALSPFRNALRLTEEFIKDILHDFNTPLSTIRLNITILKEEIGDNPNIKRIENSVQNILSLQANLRSYLHSHASQIILFDLKKLLQHRVALIEGNYKNISFIVDVKSVQLKANVDALTRIIDNLLTNAAKYNKKDGKVIVSFEDMKLKIQDTGKGIKDPTKVFDRFYKEQERGIGIGLHIVQKLCEELNIKISVESSLGEGSLFILDLENI